MPNEDEDYTPVAEWERLLRERGLRLTNLRHQVLKAIEAAGDPRSLADLCQCKELSGWTMSGVFRTIQRLCQEGVLLKLNVGDHTFRYKIAIFQPSKPRRLIFHCTNCGATIQLSQADFLTHMDTDDLSLKGMNILEVLLRGRCTKCLDQTSQGPFSLSKPRP